MDFIGHQMQWLYMRLIILRGIYKDKTTTFDISNAFKEFRSMSIGLSINSW